MAGGEIYRVEIPIIVDDQTDKPLQQAEQKISKLERHAMKENERMRQHFMKIARLQIEPVMKVRDHLTSSVSKADMLIHKLDAAQASPLIDAKDSVSAVVTKINAMLDALDKGKVDVVAEMQGPLLDEIIKAKKSLSELDNVKAGPIAELRGQLFGQLTKAMSQIKGLDLTRAEPQATLRERVIEKVKEIGSGLRNITSRAWSVTLELKDKVTGTIKNIIDKLTSPLALLGAGAGISAAIFYPLKLAGEFEQAQMSLDFYMGSVEEGKKAFEDLVRFAKETPFEFPFLQDMMIQLMGTGYDFEQAKRALTAFGDTAGRTGAGMEGIAKAMLGFTQIASTGKLTLQDLRQVALNLRIPLSMFAKELGIAESELGNIGEASISSEKAMEAIVRSLEQRFAGGLKELSNSLLGMTAVIKDTANLTLWFFGKGMAEPVKRIMFDIIGLTEDTGGAFEEFQRKLEQAGRRVGRKFEQMYKEVKRFFRDLTSTPGWNEMTWSEKVAVALDKILGSVTAWLKGPGGEAIKKTGEILGRLLAAGLEGAIPNIVPVAVELGKTLGGAVVQGIYEAIKANPWAGILLGAYIGFRIAGPKGIPIGAGIGALVWGLPKGFEALAKHIPGTDYTRERIAEYERYTRERIAEYERAKQRFEELKAVTPPGEPLFPGTEIRAMPKRAIGGIYSRPHTALVAEAGPEAIIPLSTQMRARALALYEETGRRLGVRPYAKGRFAEVVPVAAPAMSGASGIGGLFGGIIARWESIKESFQAGREAGRAAAAYAVGGILTRPHLGLVAETGPEAIIPLSARMRARAMDLWLETGRRLGVRPYEEGGFAGALTWNREQKIPVSFTPSFAMLGPATLGPATINLNFDLTGLVRQVVIESREDIDGAVDRIADAIANNLRSVFQNMTK
jgi:tape measure domain-containing protein